MIQRHRFTTGKIPRVPTLSSKDILVGNIEKATKDAIPVTKLAIEIKETDLEEKFVKGSGPGGQKINKCRHRVQLKQYRSSNYSIPSGIMVETQRFRELASNRKEARKLLKLKLDLMVNGEQSKLAIKEAKIKRRNAKQRQRAKKKYGKDDEDSSLD